MYTTLDLIPRVRETAFLNTNAYDYTDARICREMTDMLRGTFSKMVVSSKGGYWLRYQDTTCTVNQPFIRMPARACAGGLNRIQISYDSAGNYEPLDEIDEDQALNYQLATGQSGKTRRYLLRGDRIVLFPAPAEAFALRIFYYLEPPLLTPLTSTNDGHVASINTTTRVVAVTAAPLLWASTLLSSQTITTGFRAEIVRRTGWCEVVAQAELVTVSSLNYTFAGTSDMSLVTAGAGGESGDAVVAPGQSPFPPLPEEYQRLLADMTAAEICRQRRQFDAQRAIEDKCGGTLLQFKDHIQPRAQQNHRTIVWDNPYTDAFPWRAG